jgi:hypothetical protein
LIISLEDYKWPESGLIYPDAGTADPAIMTPVIPGKSTLGNQGTSADRTDRLPRDDKPGKTTDEKVEEIY